MANSKSSQFIPAAMLLCALLIMLTLDFTAASVGVCYGMMGNDLPDPSNVVALLKQHNIQLLRMYNPHDPTQQALSGSGIELVLGVPNTDLQYVAASQANADKWVQTNVKSYPNVRFRYLAVGNEVSPLISGSSQYVSSVLPALQNIQKAINSAGLGSQVAVSTAVEMTLLGTTFPPADGAFHPEVASYINPIIQHLVENHAPLLVNIYPYYTYIASKSQIDLDYALFMSPNGTEAGGVHYPNLFSAMLDSVYAALEKSGGSSLEVVVSESGWPSDGGDTASMDYAKTYNTNLPQHVGAGTPKRPGKEIETYMFDLFDENEKSPEHEKHFGLFHPNGQPKYDVSFA
ncbi:Glucan endo-1-3-beta-glucosidase- acidic isoform [Striga hermonthica]|uniref:Glucan endo-1-3-beta-glucosidase- acidic isoform n=1 Tax=Striga hermonthica TaxID=68872 RepID=A0A9N7RKN8_STRHE|nr:Glucan endo-1-3-beta-glucosidase- acidic isoform [Striga hermonthica]